MPFSLRKRLTVREIYRQLLREASYLPPLCQPYAKDRIRTRFRKHVYDDPNAPETKTRISRAQHDLRSLWAANHGVVDSMFRILMMAYGRVGQRRRELIKTFLRPEPPTDSDELAKQIEEQRQDACTNTKKRPSDWLDQWDTEKLGVLAASQAKQSFWSPKTELKNKKLNPAETIPEQNVWGRPLPAKLQRSKTRKFYKTMINKIMPPVGRDEWETLRLLATGKADRSLWQMPARRPPARSQEVEDDDKTWDWKAYATQAVRHIERGSSRSQKARTGEEGEAPYGLGSPLGLHNYNRERLWKRMYAKIWAMTPVMEKASDTKSGWRIQWGKILREIPVATPEMETFVEGAEAAGNPRMRKMKHKPKAAADASGDAE